MNFLIHWFGWRWWFVDNKIYANAWLTRRRHPHSNMLDSDHFILSPGKSPNPNSPSPQFSSIIHVIAYLDVISDKWFTNKQKTHRPDYYTVNTLISFIIEFYDILIWETVRLHKMWYLDLIRLTWIDLIRFEIVLLQPLAVRTTPTSSTVLWYVRSVPCREKNKKTNEDLA